MNVQNGKDVHPCPIDSVSIYFNVHNGPIQFHQTMFDNSMNLINFVRNGPDVHTEPKWALSGERSYVQWTSIGRSLVINWMSIRRLLLMDYIHPTRGHRQSSLLATLSLISAIICSIYIYKRKIHYTCASFIKRMIQITVLKYK